MRPVLNVTHSGPSLLGTQQSSLLGPRPTSLHAHRVRCGPPAPRPAPASGPALAPRRDHGPGWYQLFRKHRRRTKLPQSDHDRTTGQSHGRDVAARDTLLCITKQPQPDPDGGVLKTGLDSRVQVTRGEERPRNLPDGRSPTDTRLKTNDIHHIHKIQ